MEDLPILEAVSTTSTAILSFTYNPNTKDLTVVFEKRGEHDYKNVDPALILGWLVSESHGKFFNQYIRPLSP